MRNMSILNAAVLALGLFGAGGCGGGGSSNPVPIEQLDARFAHSVCAKLLECCTTAELMQFFPGGAPANAAACETQLTPVAAQFVFKNAHASITASRATYSADKAGECFDALDSAACTKFNPDNFGTVSAACDVAIVGNVAAGGACAAETDCSGTDSFCEGTSGGTATDGHCAAVPGNGESCSGPCKDGSYCDNGTSKCATLKADGTDCVDSSECKGGKCDSGTSKCVTPAPTCDGQ